MLYNLQVYGVDNHRLHTYKVKRNLLLPQFKLNCAIVLCECFKIKEDKNVLFISLATISIGGLWNIFSVNLLNNLQGGKHDKKKKAK